MWDMYSEICHARFTSIKTRIRQKHPFVWKYEKQITNGKNVSCFRGIYHQTSKIKVEWCRNDVFYCCCSRIYKCVCLVHQMWPSKYCWFKCTISEQVRFICLSIYLSIPPVRPSIQSFLPSFRAYFSLPILLCVRPFVHWPVRLCVSPFFYPSVRASFPPPIFLCVPPFVHWPVRPCVYTFFYPSVRASLSASFPRPSSSPFIFSSVLSSLRQSVRSSIFPSVPAVLPTFTPSSICPYAPRSICPGHKCDLPSSSMSIH